MSCMYDAQGTMRITSPRTCEMVFRGPVAQRIEEEQANQGATAGRRVRMREMDGAGRQAGDGGGSEEGLGGWCGGWAKEEGGGRKSKRMERRRWPAV